MLCRKHTIFDTVCVHTQIKRLHIWSSCIWCVPIQRNWAALRQSSTGQCLKVYIPENFLLQTETIFQIVIKNNTIVDSMNLLQSSMHSQTLLYLVHCTMLFCYGNGVIWMRWGLQYPTGFCLSNDIVEIHSVAMGIWHVLSELSISCLHTDVRCWHIIIFFSLYTYFSLS